MVDLKEMTAAYAEWHVGDEVIKLSPIEIAEMGQFSQWVENQYMSDMAKISEKLPFERAAEFLTKALKEKPSGIEFAIKVSKAMATVEGTKELAYISAKKYQIDITREKINSLITFENVKVVQNLIDDRSGFKVKKKGKKLGENNPDEKKKVIGEQFSASSRRLMDGPLDKSES